MSRPTLVPPEQPLANLVYRRDLRKWAVRSPANRRYLMDASKDDFFFWLRSFAWLYEPRKASRDNANSPILPFLPWPHQVPIMEAIIDPVNFGSRDFGIEKSRGEGATWSILMIFFWRWLFHPMETFGVVSRNLETADDPTDPDSLGAKIDWAIRMMPLWMTGEKDKAWKRNIAHHSWKRLDHDSTIIAYPTTGNVATGGRKTAFMVDEFAKHDRGPDADLMASMAPATDSIILISTYKGRDGEYFRVMNSESNIIKQRLFWKDNPTRNQNMFTLDLKNSVLKDAKTGEPSEFDGYAKKFFSEHLPILRENGHPIDNPRKEWSPWYVYHCCRGSATPANIAEEYDINPSGSRQSLFDATVIDDLCDKTLSPAFIGNLEYTLDTLKPIRLIPNRHGPLKIWLRVDNPYWRPPGNGRYAFGCDIASGNAGNRSSNSVISGVDCASGKKVLEYASISTPPEQLAEIAIALCHLFKQGGTRPAYLIWEGNGYGGAFRERVMLTPFRYFHSRISLSNAKRTAVKKPGWWSTRDAKRELLQKYSWALKQGFFYNPCKEALEECLCYHAGPQGSAVFVGVASDDDDSNKGELHGDRVIADALASFAMEELGAGAAAAERVSKSDPGTWPMSAINRDTYLYRQRLRQTEKKKKDWWDYAPG